jgi:hypothetical protein
VGELLSKVAVLMVNDLISETRGSESSGSDFARSLIVLEVRYRRKNKASHLEGN